MLKERQKFISCIDMVGADSLQNSHRVCFVDSDPGRIFAAIRAPDTIGTIF